MSQGKKYRIGIEAERLMLRAIALCPIAHLPAYYADVAVACRVGQVLSAHATRLPWTTYMQLSLRTVLSKP
jgi:hypothetical protein